MAGGDTTGPIVQLRRRVKATAEEIFDLWTKPGFDGSVDEPFSGRGRLQGKL